MDWNGWRLYRINETIFVNPVVQRNDLVFCNESMLIFNERISFDFIRWRIILASTIDESDNCNRIRYTLNVGRIRSENAFTASFKVRYWRISRKISRQKCVVLMKSNSYRKRTRWTEEEKRIFAYLPSLFHSPHVFHWKEWVLDVVLHRWQSHLFDEFSPARWALDIHNPMNIPNSIRCSIVAWFQLTLDIDYWRTSHQIYSEIIPSISVSIYPCPNIHSINSRHHRSTYISRLESWVISHGHTR